MNPEAIQNKVFEIEKIIESRPDYGPNYGFLTGLAGEIFFLAHYGKFYKLDEKMLQRKVQGLIDSVKAFPGDISFCSGIAGVCYLLGVLNKDFALPININTAEIKTYMSQGVESLITKDKHEFLYGLMGLAQFFLLFPHEYDEQMRTIFYYLEKSKQNILNHYAWPRLRFDGQKEVNLALSHGMASIIVILAKYYQVNDINIPEKAKIRKLIQGGLDFLVSQSIDNVKYGCYFPYTSSINGIPNASTSRLGWCYGDLSEALAIFQGATAICHNEYIEFAETIMKYAAVNRRDLSKNLVEEPGLCHGTSGIAAIFNRMWWNTGEKEYKDAFEYWIEQTQEMAKYNNSFAGYIYKSRQQWACGTHFLDGISGIGISLLYSVNQTNPSWDSCLLMSL